MEDDRLSRIKSLELSMQTSLTKEKLECPTCHNRYVDILDHIRKKHSTQSYTVLQLQPLGLTPCPTCGTACRGHLGVKTHGARIHGIIGASRISTPRRIRTPTDTESQSTRAHLAPLAPIPMNHGLPQTSLSWSFFEISDVPSSNSSHTTPPTQLDLNDSVPSIVKYEKLS